MTAKELTNQIISRGYNSMSVKQAAWFESMAAADPSINCNSANSKTSYSWREGENLVFVDVNKFSFTAKIQILKDKVA